MASAVEISRLSLAHVADAARVNSISPPDNTIQAQHCATFYPIARDECLEAFAWPFAKKAKPLVQSILTMDDLGINGEWNYAYVLPADYIRALKVVPPGAAEDFPGERYAIRSDETELDLLLFTNVIDARLHYIFREEETGRYTPMFVSALAYLLGSYVAGPILKGRVGMQVKQSLYQLYQSVISQAATRALDSGQGGGVAGSYGNSTPKWVSDR